MVADVRQQRAGLGVACIDMAVRLEAKAEQLLGRSGTGSLGTPIVLFLAFIFEVWCQMKKSHRGLLR